MNATTDLPAMDPIESAIALGDLSKLTSEQRTRYYAMVCSSVGLNPATKPFDYIVLNGKLTLYANKNAAEQLRKIHKISVNIVAREKVDDMYVVTSRAKTPDGREDESIAAVPLGTLKGEAACNAIMKCETKGKRRVTLSICSLGMLDESEIASIPNVTRPDFSIEGPPSTRQLSPGEHQKVERTDDAPCYAYDLAKIPDEKRRADAEMWVRSQRDIMPDETRPGVWIAASRLKKLAAYEVEA